MPKKGSLHVERGSWEEAWTEYIHALRELIPRRPELLSVSLLYVEPMGIIARLRRLPFSGALLFRRMAGYILRPRPAEVTIPNCAVLLCAHSMNSNSIPIVRTLARRLSEHFSVGVLHPNYQFLSFTNGSERTLDLYPFFHRPFGTRYAVALFWRALGTQIEAWVRVTVRGKFSLWKYWVNPFSAWLETFSAIHQQNVAAVFLARAETKVLVVTQSSILPCVSFLAAADERVHKVGLMHGFADPHEMPVRVDEFWVWNQTVARLQKELCFAYGADPTILTLGSAELENAKAFSPPIPPLDLPRSGLNVLFLSQAVPIGPFGREGRRAFDWIVSASARLPEVNFLIKCRPNGDRDLMSGYLRDLPSGPPKNLVLLPPDTSFHALLDDSRIPIVTSVSSTGLYVAAGLGKVTLQLDVDPEGVHHEVLEEVYTPVGSPDEFIAFVDEYSKHPEHARKRAEATAADPRRFPCSGQTYALMVKRVEELLQAALRTGPAKSASSTGVSA